MKTGLKAIGVVVILLTLCVAYILDSGGVLRTSNPHFDGTEEIIESPAGSEDLTIDTKSGYVYVSATDRRNPEKSGDIFGFTLDQKAPKFHPFEVNKIYPEFRPHGISLLKKYGKTFLFAISHDSNENYVYRLEVEGDSLINVKRFSNELFISPNDLVAIDTATFYVTNDHGIPNGIERTVKDYLLDKNGYVVLYKNGQANKVSQDMAYANGINISNDGKYLFVAATTEKTLFVFENTPNGKPLKLKDKWNTGTGLDNIEIDKYGNLIIAAHPQMLKFLQHSSNPKKRSPSQLLKIVYLPDSDYKFLQEDLYQNDGNSISGSSVGTYYEYSNGKNEMLIGSVFESKILRLHRSF
jgi:arylesterase / paraoxonase